MSHAAQCMAVRAMTLPRVVWEGPQHSRTPAAPLVVRYIELGLAEFFVTACGRVFGGEGGAQFMMREPPPSPPPQPPHFPRRPLQC